MARGRRQLLGGMDGVKLFSGSITGGDPEVAHMTAGDAFALSRAAHGLHKPVFSHPTDKAGLEVAVNNGVDILAHAAPLMGHWAPEYAEWIASRKVALVPTLSLYEQADNPRTPVATAIQQTRALKEAGGVVLFGTDAGFTDAFDPAREMRLMQDAIGWDGLLASLTTAPAARFGDSSKRGRIVAGYIADIVIVSGDPRLDLAAIGKVQMVIRSGTIIFEQQ